MNELINTKIQCARNAGNGIEKYWKCLQSIHCSRIINIRNSSIYHLLFGIKKSLTSFTLKLLIYTCVCQCDHNKMHKHHGNGAYGRVCRFTWNYASSIFILYSYIDTIFVIYFFHMCKLLLQSYVCWTLVALYTTAIRNDLIDISYFAGIRFFEPKYL